MDARPGAADGVSVRSILISCRQDYRHRSLQSLPAQTYLYAHDEVGALKFMADDGMMRSRAAAYVDAEFQHAHNNLIRDQQRQEQRELSFHKTQICSFADNRQDAELRHQQKVRGLDTQQEQAAGVLERQQRSIRGRLTGLTSKGRAAQAEQREALAERYDNLRMREHRNLEALKEQQFRAEMADRTMRARQIKLFRADNLGMRQEQWQLHLSSRDQKITARLRDMREAQQLTLRQEFNQHAKKQEGPSREGAEPVQQQFNHSASQGGHTRSR